MKVFVLQGLEIPCSRQANRKGKPSYKYSGGELGKTDSSQEKKKKPAKQRPEKKGDVHLPLKSRGKSEKHPKRNNYS